MQIIADSVHEVLPELTLIGFSDASWLAELVGDITEPGFFLVFRHETGNFTRGEQHIDVLQEFFLLDFSIRHNEGQLFALMSSDIEVLFDFFFKILFTERLRQDDLTDLVTTNISSQTGQTLFARASHTD